LYSGLLLLLLFLYLKGCFKLNSLAYASITFPLIKQLFIIITLINTLILIRIVLYLSPNMY